MLQLYPANTEQAGMISNAAMRAGFSGGLVVDFPHSTRAKKYFLVLMVGGTSAMPQAKGQDGEDSEEEEEEGCQVRVGERRHKRRKGGKDGGKKEWIVHKKQQQRNRGYTNIKPDTKYTGRKRKDRF